MTSKLGAYLKTKEATGTTGHTDLPNPNDDLNPNSNSEQAWDLAACCSGSDQAAQPNTRNSSGDEIANVNFLYDDIVHVLQNTIDSCINYATDGRGYVLERNVYQIQLNNAL